MRGSMGEKDRLVVISNRLPFVLKRDEGGEWLLTRGSGGLITALHPALKDRGGLWIGWPGTTDDPSGVSERLQRSTLDAGYELVPVLLSAEEVSRFYQGFSNEILWPLFHDLQSICNFDPSYWKVYQQVNRKYAEVTVARAHPQDFIWVHDYHLMNMASELRQLGFSGKLAFFLHIPFPPPDIFVKMPWRADLVRSLLDYDLIGFQTLRDRRNFLQCLRTLVRDVEVHSGETMARVEVGSREVRVGVFPISIDVHAFERAASSPQVTERVEQLKQLLPGGQLILGIDRLDYTKGIVHRLQAFRNALLRYPELHNRVSLIQVVVPSREDIPKYHDLKAQIEQLVSQINGQFSCPGWIPITYLFRSLERTELLAYYRAAQIALVTPLKDGMNLVAKEYCACSLDEDCVLILSEFAGAAAQLHRWALMVNPYDIEGVADAIYKGFQMGLSERRWHMRGMRRAIRKQDIYWWLNFYLQAAIHKDLTAFPIVEDYTPSIVLTPPPPSAEHAQVGTLTAEANPPAWPLGPDEAPGSRELFTRKS